MWISSNLLKLTIYFVGSCCQLCRVLTQDPSLIWNIERATGSSVFTTVMCYPLKIRSFDFDFEYSPVLLPLLYQPLFSSLQ